MRLAIVGCGAAAEWYHLPAVERVVPEAELVFVDPDLDRARSVARRRGRAESSHRGLEVDAAIVAVPNHLHAAVARDLLDSGARVLVEKPLARSAAEGRTIVDAAVANFRRCFRSSRLVAEAIAELGGALRFEAEEGFVYAWSARSGFILDWDRAGGGVLLDIGTHVLDQLRLWLGELELVRYADDAHGGLEADCRMELANGTLELSRTRLLRNTVRIECERGTVEAPLPRSGAVVVNGEARGAEEQDGGYADAFAAQLDAFLRGAPAATGQDAISVLTLVDACYARREPLAEPWTTETLERR